MKSLRTEIMIEAPKAVVWKQLLDFESYPDWNPFIHIQGKPQVGAQLYNKIFLDEGKKPQIFKPKVLVCDFEKEFKWKGQLFFTGLFDGEHYFILEAIDATTTRLIHGENFSGIFSRLILGMIKEDTLKGFQKMNESLQERCHRMANKSLN